MSMGRLQDNGLTLILLLMESTWTDGGYAYPSGTSMATPHVSGLAAKLWNHNAAQTRADLQTLQTLEDIWIEGDDPVTGFGLPHL